METKKPGSLIQQIIKSKEFIVTVASIISAIGIISKLVAQPEKDFHTFSLVMEALNILILIIALVIFSKEYTFHLPQDPDRIKVLIEQEVVTNPATHARNYIALENKIRQRVKMVSKLVKQLLNALKGFAICLILLYAFLFIADVNKEKEARRQQTYTRQIQDTLNIYKKNLFNFTLAYPDRSKNYVYVDMINSKIANANKQLNLATHLNDSIQNKYTNNTSLLDLIMSKDTSNKTIVSDILVSLVDNFFNVLSTAFLLIAFYILYHRAVDVKADEELNTSNGYWISILMAVVLILISTMIIITGFCDQSLQSLLVWMRISGGIFNGIGMALLVSRFISMEYLYKQSDDIVRNFYLIGTIVVLPMYVVVQPLWGIFQTNIENREVLTEIVLMLCLWGKIFFIMIVYYMLNNRWLHTYIYLMPMAEERIKLVTEKFDDIVANIKKDKIIVDEKTENSDQLHISLSMQ